MNALPNGMDKPLAMAPGHVQVRRGWAGYWEVRSSVTHCCWHPTVYGTHMTFECLIEEMQNQLYDPLVRWERCADPEMDS